MEYNFLTEMLHLIYDIKPPENKDHFTLEYVLESYHKASLDIKSMFPFTYFANFVKNSIWTSETTISFLYNFLSNKIYDFPVFCKQIVDICNLYGENIYIKKFNANGLKLDKTKLDSVFDPDNINLILTDKKAVQAFLKQVQELNKENKFNFMKEFSKPNCRQKLKINSENYYKLILFINSSNLVFSKYEIGFNWYRSKVGESFLEVKPDTFISCKNPEKFISKDELFTKKPLLLGRISTYKINGFQFVHNCASEFLTKFFKKLANENNKEVKHYISIFEYASDVIKTANRKKNVLSQITTSLKAKTFKTPDESMRLDSLQRIINNLDKSIEQIKKESKIKQQEMLKFAIKRDVAQLALGKQKEFLQSFKVKK